MAPQFTAIYLLCFLWERAWIILGMLSFPTPLSPVTKTDMSVGATRMAFSKARFSLGSLPMIPKRCLIPCMFSISTCRHYDVLIRSEEHTSELQSRPHLVCRLLLE